MEMPKPMSKTTHYDAVQDEISTRRNEIGLAKELQREGAVHSAESKLEAYRVKSHALKSYNRTTERLLASPAGTHRQQQPQQLKRPTANVSNGRAYPSSSREQDEPRGGEGGSGGSKASNGMEGEQQQQNGRSEYSVYSRGGPTGSSMHHLSKANRALTLKVKTLEEEIGRYKRGLDSVHNAVDDISNESMTTDQNVANLAEDLRNERANHENLRRSLEQAMRDIEERTALLAEAEQESQANHEKNLELTRTIQEMTSVAEEQRVQWQQQLLQQQQQLLEQQQLQQEQQQDLAASNSRGGNGELVDGGGGEGDGEEQEEVESLRRELEKLKAAMKLKTRELEAVNARATRTALELRSYKGDSSSGRIRNFLFSLWALAKVVGFVGFGLFAYVAVSEDAFRSRGIDVYRLSH
eukprot:jgi/Undpi1/903/HiC_scaffold_10.g04367.m1